MIVKLVGVRRSVGVPEITQVLLFTVAQIGNGLVDTFVVHPVIMAPLLFKKIGAMDIGEPTMPTKLSSLL
jgi:hypothetical protein